MNCIVLSKFYDSNPWYGIAVEKTVETEYSAV